ncbi:hypothetical protein DIBJMFBN_02483 [Mannheimia haemolytica]
MGKTSFGDKAGSFGRGLMGAGVGIAAGAAMARQPARNQMEFDRQLAMVANTAFSDRDVKGRIDGKRELLDAVQKAVSVGGGSKEEALSSLDALLASGAVSTETALEFTPNVAEKVRSQQGQVQMIWLKLLFPQCNNLGLKKRILVES